MPYSRTGMRRVTIVTPLPAPATYTERAGAAVGRRAEVAAMLDRALLILGAVLLLATLLLERPTPMAIAPREVQRAASGDTVPNLE